MSVEQQNIEAASSHVRSGKERRSVFNRRRHTEYTRDGRGEDRRVHTRRALLSQKERESFKSTTPSESSLLDEAATLLIRCRDALLYHSDVRVKNSEINEFLEKIK